MSSRIQIQIAWLLFFCTSCACATESSTRFVQKLALPFKQTAVVAEGDFEARSTGSYSIRIYSTERAQPGDDSTFFSSGIIRAREGTVEKVFLASLGKNEALNLVVAIRSAGTGGYLSADAFIITKNKITLRASVSGLPPNADPVVALKASLRRKKSP
jgi:hypothetical protein